MLRIPLNVLILLLFFLILPSKPARKPELHALCIGVNAYNLNNNRLSCPFNRDAIVIHDVLVKSNAKSKLLYGNDATYDEVCKSLKHIIEISRKEDITFILFSTH